MKCSCGKRVERGQQICRHCGKPLDETIDMRYEGASIRSKTKKKSVIDKIWALFANVKFGVTLIFVTLIFAALGTILPQVLYVDTSSAISLKDAYEQTYGTFGKWYYLIGLADIYNSWWFQLIVACLAASIIIASFDRGIPLFKSLYNQRIQKHPLFLKKQRLQLAVNSDAVSFEQLAGQLHKQKFKVNVEGRAILAEKGRFARFGPYINHLGLIIFLAGIMLRFIPGFYVDEEMWVREGDTVAIPGMEHYYVENKHFLYETYDATEQSDGVNTVAKTYQTKAVVYEGQSKIIGDDRQLKKVASGNIEVNHPLKVNDFALYQMDYRLGELKSMTFHLIDKATEVDYGEVEIDLFNPKETYILKDDAKVEITGYYPDFTKFDANGEPQSASPNPNNPAFLFKMTTKEKPKGEISFVRIQKTIEPLGPTTLKMAFKEAEKRDVTGLKVRKDKTLPFLIIGGVIFMIGITIGSYFSHRRIWIIENDDKWLMAAHTNKNWHGIEKELKQLTETLQIPMFNNQKESKKYVTNDE